jgi:hypothetical protein
MLLDDKEQHEGQSYLQNIRHSNANIMDDDDDVEDEAYIIDKPSARRATLVEPEAAIKPFARGGMADRCKSPNLLTT